MPSVNMSMSTESPFGQQKTFADRLRWARGWMGLSMEDLGKLAGVTRSYISKLEADPAKMPSDRVTDALCRSMLLKRGWLLYGEGEAFSDPRMELAAREGRRKPFLGSPEDGEDVEEARAREIVSVLVSIHRGWRELVASLDALLDRDFDSIPTTSWRVARMLVAEIAARVDDERGDSWRHTILNKVDSRSANRNSKPVVPEWSVFLEDLRKLTQRRGLKNRLAKHLGVPPSRISEWMSGKAEPSGRTTLRLLSWVQSGGFNDADGAEGAATPSAPETQPGNTDADETRSGPH